MEGRAFADQFGNGDGEPEEPVHGQRGAAELLVIANIGNTRQDLHDPSEDQRDDQRADFIGIGDAAQLSYAQCEGSDRETEQANRQHVDSPVMLHVAHRPPPSIDPTSDDRSDRSKRPPACNRGY